MWKVEKRGFYSKESLIELIEIEFILFKKFHFGFIQL